MSTRLVKVGKIICVILVLFLGSVVFRYLLEMGNSFGNMLRCLIF